MSELMSQLITPELMTAFTVFIVLLVVLLHVLSISVGHPLTPYMRGRIGTLGMLRLYAVGVIACPPSSSAPVADRRDEQELEVALKQRELMKYGECANCGYPVESDYVYCLVATRLKNLCELPSCARACMDCVPYCATPVGRTATVGRLRAAVLDAAGLRSAGQVAREPHNQVRSRAPRTQNREKGIRLTRLLA